MTSQWLRTMPAFAETTLSMKELTAYTSIEQHKQAGNLRMERDRKDTLIMLLFNNENRNPFGGSSLKLNKINRAGNANEVEKQIIGSMIVHGLSTSSFKRYQQVIILHSRTLLTIYEEPLDPPLLIVVYDSYK